MRLFVAHFVVLEEEMWLAKRQPLEGSHKLETYRLVSQLFAARDAESAYEKASKMIDGLSDSNCDCAGDRTDINCLGIHDLEEVNLFENSLPEAVLEPYGVEVGCVQWQNANFPVRAKNELSLFKYKEN